MYTSTETLNTAKFDPITMAIDSQRQLTTVIGGGVDSQFPLVTSEFSIVDSTAYCNNNKINYYFAYAAIEAYKIPDSGFYVKVGGLYDTTWRIINFTTSTSGTDVTFTVSNTDVKTSGTWFTYNTTTGTITATGSVFDEYTDTFYNSYVNVSDQKYVKELDSVAAKEAGLVSTVDATFIPVDGTSIVVDSNGKLAATGGSGSSYTFTNGLTENSGTVSNDLYTNANVTVAGSDIKFKLDYASVILGQSVGESSGIGSNVVIGSGSIGSGQNVVIGQSCNGFNYKQTIIGFSVKGSTTKAGQTVIGNKNAIDNDSSFVFADGDNNSTNPNLMVIKSDGTVISKNLPAVSGTDGTYQLTATTSSGATTYSWAAGGSGSGKYMHKVQIFANYGGTSHIWTEDFVSSSATPYTSLTDYLSDRNYIITGTSDTLTKYIVDNVSGSNYALAIMTGTTDVYLGTITVSSGPTVSATWAIQTASAIINDEVIAL